MPQPFDGIDEKLGRRAAGPLALAAWLVLTTMAGATEKTAQTPQTATRRVAGDVFVVTKGGTNYKLGLVTVRAIPESALKKHLERRRQECEQQRAKSGPEMDRAKAEYDAAKAEGDQLYAIAMADALNDEKMAAWKAATVKSREAASRLSDVSISGACLGSPAFFYEGLPAGVSTAKTDADGKFTMQIPSTGRFALAARSSREVGRDEEQYFWVVWAPPGGTRVMLSNDNMMGQGSPESAWK